MKMSDYQITEREVYEATQKIRALMPEMEALNQPRSNHILRQQVIGQHNMPGRQREQLLTELRGLLFAVEDLRDDIELTQIEIDDIMKSTRWRRMSQRQEVELRKLNRRISSQKFELAGRMREIAALINIAEEIKPYSREALEAEEPEYWARRISEQAERKRIEHLTGWDGGNITAAINMLTTPGEVKPQLGNLSQIMDALQIPYNPETLGLKLIEAGDE